MSVISDLEKQVLARMKELEPAVEEYRQLEAVAATFVAARAGTATADRRPAKEGRPRRAASSRRSPSGGRAAEALTLVADSPGITATDLAERMGIGPTYLYRLLPELVRDGKLVKDGKRYHPVAGTLA